MSDDKKFGPSNSESLFNKNSEDKPIDPIWFLLLEFLILGCWPSTNSNESYLKGKIDAYENILKGFDDNGR